MSAAARCNRRRLLFLVLLVGLALAALAGPANARPERPAPVGSDPFTAGRAYRGDFPDPTVLAGRRPVLRRAPRRSRR